ncbi:MAG: sensor histidine kinase, partial [Pirellulaceae bacterium]
SHRIKNTLATVQAIVQGLGQRCDSLPEFLVAFESRLAALARAPSILTVPGDERVGLRGLLNRELAPYVGDVSHRLRIEGDELTLARDSAIAMELVFHELVTNATKYGALSNDTGTVTVRCEHGAGADGAPTRIEWVESGGPPIESQSESGFGSLLIRSSVSHDLGGAVDMRFEPHGLHCTIAFPLTHNGVKE